MSDRYAVIGHPVSHSLSPRIHALFAQQTGQDMVYEALPAPLDGFERTVRHFVDQGGRGLNVTLPFKQEAWRLADACSERARLAGAVNTLVVRDDGSLYGDNTDGVGLVTDLTRNMGLNLRGRHILLVGAGGAVRGVLQPLLEQAPARLVIANRTASRARDLARHFAALGPVTGCGLDELDDQAFDLVINGTSASLSGEVPPLPHSVLRHHGAAYDMMYSAEPTAFVNWALDHGAGLAQDGLGMLVEQAAESFQLWRGVRPDTGAVMETIRGELQR